MSVKDIKKVDGIWTMGRMEMVTKKGKRFLHATVITFTNMVYNKEIGDDMFTTQRMERGL